MLETVPAQESATSTTAMPTTTETVQARDPGLAGANDDLGAAGPGDATGELAPVPAGEGEAGEGEAAADEPSRAGRLRLRFRRRRGGDAAVEDGSTDDGGGDGP